MGVRFGVAAVVAKAEPEGEVAAAIAGAGLSGGGVRVVECPVLALLFSRWSVASCRAAAAEYGYSRRHLYRVLARYRQGGLDGLEPRSRASATNPAQTSAEIRRRVIELRGQLTATAHPVAASFQGEDAFAGLSPSVVVDQGVSERPTPSIIKRQAQRRT